MRVSTIAAGFTALLVPASALSIYNGNAPATLDDPDLDIPGESPLKFCSADRSKDLVTIERVDLTPNPPVAGNDLVIQATGTVNEKIEEGAYVKLLVKYGYVRLLSITADFCEQIKNVDLECPVEAGKLHITKTVELPKEIPPGTYNVVAEVFTKDDVPITCLTASVPFGVRKAAGFFNIEL